MSSNHPTTRTIVVDGRAKAVAFQKYRLEVHSNGDRHTFDGDKQHVVIGSDAGADITVTDPGVSRAHCEILIEERGYLLRDLDSKNGTRLDGVPVMAAWLSAGSTITVGATRLEFNPTKEVSEIPLSTDEYYGQMIGPSVEMRALFAILERVAAEDVTILVEGESGTGKELIVQELHAHSGLEGSLVVFDCSAIPENLAESELFGHVKGAFTGATSDRDGAVRQAHGGTLFLDEIGELPLDLQPKLLRALESRQVKPVGGSKTYDCDVRVVAATNRNLAEEVRKGSFRQDLYFRLNVVRVQVPPLRRRREDVPALVHHFLKASWKGDGEAPVVPPDVISMLQNHEWPGNVRELKNFVDRYRLFAPRDAAGAARLIDDEIGDDNPDTPGFSVRYDQPYKDVKADLIQKLEVEYFGRLLSKHAGNVAACAREAGMHRKYLEELVRKHGLKQKS